MGDARSGGFESTVSADTHLAAEDDVLEQGSTLGERYRIENTLGSGGMGHVYRARDLELGRDVALKTMRRSASTDARRRFRREVKLALRITHPNVVRMFDLGSADGTDFVTMEIVPGESLEQILRNGKLSPDRAAAIAAQTALGLAAAHEAGVIHRDLKPGNIIIDGERVVVVDFGVAGEDVQGQVAASAIVGTSAYMSPEQANGEAPTPQTDLYALGLVMYEMLVGEVPLVGNGPVATALRRQREKPTPVRRLCPDAPRGLESLISGLLSLEPSGRPNSAREVAALLSTLSDEGERPPRSDRSFVLGSVAVIAALAIGFGVWSLTRHRGPAKAAANNPAIDESAEKIFSIARGAKARFSEELRFLEPHIASAAFRALAAQLPGRVGTSERGGGAPVNVVVEGKPGAITATLRCAGVTVSQSGATPVAALDRAAAALMTSLLPTGPEPSSREQALRHAWGAKDVDEVRRFRRIELAFARRRPDAAKRARAIERPGFVRPHMVALMAHANLGPAHAMQVATARNHAVTAPAKERLILAGLIGVLSNDKKPAKAIAHDPLDPWSLTARIWRAAYDDRIDEAFSLASLLARDPELGGIGRSIEIELARYYRAGALMDSAAALTRALPEEPVAWLELASAYASFGRPEDAVTMLARAQALGAAGGTFEEVDATIALVELDFDRARAAARRLIGRAETPWKLEGQRLLYAVDIMTGRFDQALRRATALEKLMTSARTVEAAEAAIWLGLDAYARRDYALARRFALVARLASRAVSDHEYDAMAAALQASTDYADKTIDEAKLRARLNGIAAQMRKRGHDPASRVALPMARLRAAEVRGDCTGIATAARGYERQSQAIIALARCDLKRNEPARALARLSAMFHGVERSTAPTLFVHRELALGRAYMALDRHTEARTHLGRVVQLWKHASDRGEVESAQRLLLTLRPK